MRVRVFPNPYCLFDSITSEDFFPLLTDLYFNLDSIISMDLCMLEKLKSSSLLYGGYYSSKKKRNSSY